MSFAIGFFQRQGNNRRRIYITLLSWVVLNEIFPRTFLLFVAVLSQSQLRLPTCRAIQTSESFCRARRVTSFHITDLVHSPLKTYTRCVTPAVANGRGSLLPGVMLTKDPMHVVAQHNIDIENANIEHHKCHRPCSFSCPRSSGLGRPHCQRAEHRISGAWLGPPMRFRKEWSAHVPTDD